MQRRALRHADARVWRALVALAFHHRERAIVLEALGVRGAATWREGRSLDGLYEHAALAEGGLELLEALLRGELLGAAHDPDRLDPHAFESPAALAEAWERAHEGPARMAAVLLFVAATSEGFIMRRLEARMLEELEARAWRDAGAPASRSSARGVPLARLPEVSR
jgi:hypothetical protein